MVAQMGGAVSCEVAVVKANGKFFVKAPSELGGKVESVPADSLVDCINYKTWEWNQELKAKNRVQKVGQKTVQKTAEKKVGNKSAQHQEKTAC